MPSSPDEPTSLPTFILGLGAQKAGTTWLSDYLRSSPHFAAGFRKEYHVFDLLEPAIEPERRVKALSAAMRELQAIARGEDVGGTWLHVAAMLADQERYFDFFAALISDDPSVTVTGDLTPSYSMLAPATLARIKSGFGERGIRVVPVFLMRDPVERLWSATRMHVQRRPEGDPHAGAVTALRRRYRQPAYEMRTRYDQTLSAIEQVFDPRDSFVGFYETLFDEATTAALCAVIGIAAHPPAIDRRSNPTARSHPALPESMVRAIAEHYAPVYDDVARRFPQVALTELWPSARFGCT